jgi:hypothetical protein
VNGVTVSADVFSVLSVQPVSAARTAQEDLDPGNSVIVLGHEFWQQARRRRRDRHGVDDRRTTPHGCRRDAAGVAVTGRKADLLLPWHDDRASRDERPGARA